MKNDVKNALNIGGGGEFPDGKIDDSDEGELTMAVGVDRLSKQVIIDFGTSLTWIGMSADEADGLADLLKKKAAELK